MSRGGKKSFIFAAVISWQAAMSFFTPSEATAYEIPACLKGNVWSTSLKIKNNQFIMPVELNGKRIGAVFDTGAVTNALPFSLHQKYSMIDAHRSMPIVAPGMAPVPMHFFGGTINIGGKSIKERAFIEPQFVNNRKDIMLLAISAVIESYDFLLDVENGNFMLMNSAPCGNEFVPIDGAYEALPISRPKSGQGAAVTVSIGDQQFSALLDTGSDRTILSMNAARMLGVSEESLKGFETSSTVINGVQLKGYFYKLDRFRLGESVFTDLNVIIQDVTDDVVLGADILKKYNIFVGHDRNNIYFSSQLK